MKRYKVNGTFINSEIWENGICISKAKRTCDIIIDAENYLDAKSKFMQMQPDTYNVIPKRIL